MPKKNSAYEKVAMEPETYIWIGTQDFDVNAEYKALCQTASHSGAVVFFVGLVRDIYFDQKPKVSEHCRQTEQVEHIELEHYPGMTEKQCQNIIDQANHHYPFDAVRLLHRVGRLCGGDQIVMVAVASQHRENAFQAAQFIMDFLKTRAPFWKREVGTRGTQWLGVKQKDREAAARWQVD